MLEQGITSFSEYILNLKLIKSSLKELLVESDEFQSLVKFIENMGDTNHPKLNRTGEILEEFLSGGTDSKAIVFTNGRSTAQEINEFLSQRKGIRASVFVGQQSKQV